MIPCKDEQEKNAFKASAKKFCIFEVDEQWDVRGL